jgi:dTDP-6-deoxy-L-talose 4-dehydrogenase (NAD+)
MSRRILVTGATGFVGNQVVRFLLDKGTQLRLIVRKDKEASFNPNRTLCEIITTEDLFAESSEWWAEQCENIDTVIHLAWYTEPGKYLQSPKNLDCLSGSLELVKGAIQAGIKRFVGIGTCFEYDLTSGVLSVDTPIKPITIYADTKAALYTSLSHWLPLQSVEFAWCRLFYLYGQGEDSRRFVPYIRSKLENDEPAELTSGMQIRDYLDVNDAGRMIADVALGNQCGPINICSGLPITVRQFAEQIADEYGRRDLLVFGARPDNLVDPPCVLGIPNVKLL